MGLSTVSAFKNMSVDESKYVTMTDEQLKELVDYSAQFGVKIWLWRHGRDMHLAYR